MVIDCLANTQLLCLAVLPYFASDDFVRYISVFIAHVVTFVQVLRRFIKIDNELREPVSKEEIVAEVCLMFFRYFFYTWRIFCPGYICSLIP